jgi:hypothetical protein
MKEMWDVLHQVRERKADDDGVLRLLRSKAAAPADTGGYPSAAVGNNGRYSPSEPAMPIEMV